MAGSETRLLLLGAVALFEPVNGYQIRRELVSWQVDRWAHTNPGSIYSGLATLTRQGLLRRHDLDDGGRDVAVYELTDAGRESLERLLVEALETVDVYDRGAFTAAFSMLPLIGTERAAASLAVRAAALERTVGDFEPAPPGEQPAHHAPPHAVRGWHLWGELARAELSWLRETIEQLARGDLDRDWTPPPDDPGWQMQRDRERYRELLDGR